VNYITDDSDYCDICLAEMSGQVLNVEVEDEELELCPKCHQNYIVEGDRYCESCLLELSKLKGSAVGDIDWSEDEVTDVIVDDEEIFEPDEVSLEGLVGDEEWESDDSADEELKSPDAFADEILELDMSDFTDDEDIDLTDDELNDDID
jgi:hypothetical protein